jgi:Ca2+-binding RTX toxin-like protein
MPLSLAWAATTATPSSAAPSCTYDNLTSPSSANVSIADGEAVTISRDVSGTIYVNASTCPSTTDASVVATVTNTDTINVPESVGAGVGNTRVTIDLANGGFAPGATLEPNSSSEIEFNVSLAGAPGDSLSIASAGATGSVVAGDLGNNGVGIDQTGVNLDADEGDGVDADVTATGLTSLTMNGVATSDVLSAGGGSGTGAPAAVPAVLNGNNGADLLIGGNAGDTLNGNLGDDELRGGAGNDTLSGAGGDDLLVGGPGDDNEAGAGGNDVWIQTAQSTYSATSPQVPKTVKDATSTTVGSTVSTLDVNDSPGNPLIYDVNARVCLTSPNNSLSTKELTVKLTSPPQATVSADGTTVQAFTRPGGVTITLVNKRGDGTPYCYGIPSSGIQLDSEAFTTIGSAASCVTACRAFDGRFHPEDSLELLDNWRAVGYNYCVAPCPATPNTTWKLTVVDNTPSTGPPSNGAVWTLKGWSIEITYRSDASDGNDTVTGGPMLDLVDYSGRGQNLAACLSSNAAACPGGVATSGQAGEADSLGTTGAPAPQDVEQVYAGPGNDNLVGNDSVNELRGAGGSDTINGLGGNDVIFGGVDDDAVYGGAGDDTVYGGMGADSIDGNDGVDTANFGRSPVGVVVDMCGTYDPVAKTCSGPATATGEVIAPPQTCNPTYQAQIGSSCNDTLLNTENVAGTPYNDTITGNTGVNLLTGIGGNDTIRGLDGNDTLNGGPGNDSLDAGAGFDWVSYGGSSTPGVTVDLSGQDPTCAGAPCAYGSAGTDSIQGAEAITGSSFADTLTGSSIGNYISGGAGNDKIYALDGLDKVYGNDGDDVLDCGVDAFTDIYDGGTGSNTITNCP